MYTKFKGISTGYISSVKNLKQVLQSCVIPNQAHHRQKELAPPLITSINSPIKNLLLLNDAIQTFLGKSTCYPNIQQFM